ncbi:ACP S-malonyltransferase [soil metagenome]
MATALGTSGRGAVGYAVLFPGQGSQFVGMGADIFESRPDLVGDSADLAVGFSLRDTCLNGPAEELTKTEHAQPALFALSYALWDELSARVPPPAASAGHSLGEYTALVAAGVIGYWDALTVVAERGRAMAAAAEIEESGMAALIGIDADGAEQLCATRRHAGGRLWVANLNAPGQVVVAGAAEDLEWLSGNGRDLGVRRVIPLEVAGAFHSPLMEPAAERVARALAAIDPAPPRFPVYANVSAIPVRAGEVKAVLASQMVSAVRFSETLQSMAAAGIHTFVHVGPGDVTAGLVKRTVGDARVVVVSSRAGVSAAVDTLGTIA